MHNKKKTLILTLIFSLLIPLTVFSILEENGAFDTRSQAESQLLEQFVTSDVDGNGIIDINDFEVWLDIWKDFKVDRGAYTNIGDIDGDGVIGISDFAMWLVKWRQYKAYAANPDWYAADRPESLVAEWPLDEQAGSGSFLRDMISNQFNALPEGTDYYSSGIFGASRLMNRGDSIFVNNGEELPLGDTEFMMSFWMNLLDNSMFELGDSPDALTWDSSSQKFSIMSLGEFDFDMTELIDMFENIDIEGMMKDSDKGWFNMITSFDPITDMTEYYVNGSAVGSFDSSKYADMTGINILALIPEDNEVAFDNFQAWGGGEDVDVDTVYAGSSCPYADDENDDKPDPFTNPDPTDDKFYKDPNYEYEILGYERRQCIVCSSSYKGVKAHFDIEGYSSNSYPTDTLCSQAASGSGEYKIKSGSLFYTCDSNMTCGGLAANYQPTNYPGDSGSVGSEGINSKAEYLECIDYIVDKSTLTQEEKPHMKQCSACSTRYYLVAAYWNGTCNEATDEERIAVDPNLIFKCRRCGTPSDPEGSCVFGGYPSPNDEIFAKHYSNPYSPHQKSAYENYTDNCSDARENCPDPIVNTSRYGCRRCSSDFKYAYATWDPGPDGICYVDTDDDLYTNDDLYDTATYTCDCSCTANLRPFSGKWSGIDYSTYGACENYCDSL